MFYGIFANCLISLGRGIVANKYITWRKSSLNSRCRSILPYLWLQGWVCFFFNLNSSLTFKTLSISHKNPDFRFLCGKKYKKFLSPWASMLAGSVLSSNCGVQWSHIHCAHSYYPRGSVVSSKKGRNFRTLQYRRKPVLFLVLLKGLEK